MDGIASVRNIFRSSIKPKHIHEKSRQPSHLTPWDVSMLSSNYIEKGLFFPKPKTSMATILDNLKDSLSETLTHFFPLAGRLATKKFANPPSCSIFLDSSNPPGAEFIYSTMDASMFDVLSPIHSPPIVDRLFNFDEAINHDGHHLPLLGVKVTELIDGIVISCSLNHVVGDGASFWHFFNSWSEISRTSALSISRPPSHPPVTERWFLDDRLVNLPYSKPDEFIERYIRPPYKERIFHFSQKSISQLKAKANSDCNTSNISTFQALTAHVWRCITRACQLSIDQEIVCWFPIDDRSKLDPPLSQSYFGNAILMVPGAATAGKLLENNLGWSAMMLQEQIKGHTDSKIRATLERMTKVPVVIRFGDSVNKHSLIIGGSPRFDVYGNDFGWGKPVAIRSGYGNKFDGKVTLYPGREGGGSVDMEVCLSPESMTALESDDRFMNLVSCNHES